MDVYGHSTTSEHVFHIDDLLDFSNDQIFSSASSPDDDDSLLPAQPPLDAVISSSSPSSTAPPLVSSVSHEFTDGLYFPEVQSDDVAELEWLSRFVDDSYADDIPANSLTTAMTVGRDIGSLSCRPKGRRSMPIAVSSKLPAMYGGDAAVTDGVGRRCKHCASEKTPQWRTGPMGPKTLCNACGVRYKSGRLVPEYRPAASPTFVLTQHSNSHRKVVELRRQKEVQMQQCQHDQMYGHRHHRHPQHHDFEVC